MLLKAIRKLLCRDVVINISITPTTVVRPGDCVMLGVPGLRHEDRARIQATIEKNLPSEARVMIHATEPPFNLTWLVEQLVDRRRKQIGDLEDLHPDHLSTKDFTTGQ